MKKIPTLIVTILCIFISFSIFAQSDTLRKKKFNPFIYSENDQEFVLDAGGGTGFSNVGISAVAMAGLDFYHILAGYRYSYSFGFKEEVGDNSFLMGYRLRNKNFMLALASGFAWQECKCTSGLNSDCYFYEEGQFKATPINLQVDAILTDWLAMGINFHQMISARKNTESVFLTLKFGAFRNIY